MEYEKTRHNAGFMVIDEIANEAQVEVNRVKFEALVGEYMSNGEKIMLVKPQTYMNLSGQSVKQIVNFYKLNLEDLVIIYDDIDIEFGKIRIRPSGSPGTHNGMRNITECLGTQGFARVRMGIGKPDEHMELKDFVLKIMDENELEIYLESAKIASKAIKEIIENGVRNAMNKYNSNANGVGK